METIKMIQELETHLQELASAGRVDLDLERRLDRLRAEAEGEER